MNDNAPALSTVKVQILKGTHAGNPRPRWFVNMCFNDDSELISDDHLSHACALASAREVAVEYGVEIEDLSPEGLAS